MKEISIKRNLKRAIPKLNGVSLILELEKNIKEEALKIYNLLLKRKTSRAFSIESTVTACIYTACRLNRIPRTLDEIHYASGIEIKEIGRIYKTIIRKLNLKVDPINPEKFILRFAERLNLSQKVKDEALKYFNEVKDFEVFRGKNPIGIAASSLYLASLINNEKRTQRELSDVAGIREVTIKHGHKLIINNLEELKDLSDTNANKIRSKQENEVIKGRKNDIHKYIEEKTEKEKKKYTKRNLEAFQKTINHVEGYLLAFGASEEYEKGVKDCVNRLKEEIRRARRVL